VYDGHAGNRSEADEMSPLLPCLLVALLMACVAPGPSADPPSHMESEITRWFSALAEHPPGLPGVARPLAQSPLEFALTEGENAVPADLRAWLVDLRSPHPRVEYELDRMSATRVGDQLHRVRFEVTRRAVDAEGLPHVARSRQTWLIRDRAGLPPTVLRAENVRLLSFPGTGSQIVCY